MSYLNKLQNFTGAENHHTELFRIALSGFGSGKDATTIISDLMNAAASYTVRAITEREIISAVEDAGKIYDTFSVGGNGVYRVEVSAEEKTEQQKQYKAQMLKFIDAHELDMFDIVSYFTNESKIDFRVQENRYSALKELYKDDELIYVSQNVFAKKNEDGVCLQIDTVAKKTENKYALSIADQFSINPFLSRDGRKKDNVASFRYALWEIDDLFDETKSEHTLEETKKSLERQLKLIYLLHVAGMPFASITYSGGKSYHCLIKLNTEISDLTEWDEVVKNKLFKYARIFNVDSACIDCTRLSRTPWSKRSNNEVIQKCFFVDGETNGNNPVEILQKFIAENNLTVFDKYDRYNDFYSETKSEPIFDLKYDKDGNVSQARIYQLAFAKFYSYCNDIIFSTDNDMFYIYDEKNGLWISASDKKILTSVSEELEKTTKDLKKETNGKFSNSDITYNLCSQLTHTIAGLQEEDNFFNRPKKLVHAKNGMVLLGDEDKLVPFSKMYRSRNRTEVAYNPNNTKIDRFMEFLRSGVSEEDIILLQKYAGQCLLGDNISQKILVLQGMAGQGKSTLSKIIQKMVNAVNCTELRVSQLSSRFEISRCVGKTLLFANDVKSNFLNTAPAAELKSLCGGDNRSIEFKGANGERTIKGHFNIIITSNNELSLKLDGDADAWLRRMLIVKYERNGNCKPIPDLDEVLIREEGEGILNWMLSGAKMLMNELQTTGRFQVTEEQFSRIRKMIERSDTIQNFCRVIYRDAEAEVSSENLQKAYVEYCRFMEWEAEPIAVFQKKITDLLLNEFQVIKSDNVKNEFGKRCKGYKGIAVHNFLKNEKLVCENNLIEDDEVYI